MSQEAEPFHVALGSDDTLTFRSEEEVSLFLKEERESLPFIQEGSSLGNIHRRLWDRINQEVTLGTQNANPLQRRGHFVNALSNWSQAIRDKQFFYSKSPTAEFLIQLNLKNRNEAISAAHYFAGETMQSSNQPQFAGFLQAGLFQLGITGHEVAQQHLQATQQLMDTVLREMIENEASRLTSSAALIVEFRSHCDKLLNKEETAFSAKRAEYDRDWAELREKLTALEGTYNDKLALSAPVEYWNTVHIDRSRMAFWFGVVFFISLIVGGGLISLMLWMLLTQDQPPAWRIGIAITAGLFVVWAIRVFAKLMFSNLHLSVDAKERATLIVTYLAMLKQSDAMKPEDRAFVLGPLFARTAAGSGKVDDLSPHIVQALLTKAKGD